MWKGEKEREKNMREGCEKSAGGEIEASTISDLHRSDFGGLED